MCPFSVPSHQNDSTTRKRRAQSPSAWRGGCTQVRQVYTNTHTHTLALAARPPGFFQLAGVIIALLSLIPAPRLCSHGATGSSSVVAGVITSSHLLTTCLRLHRTLTKRAVSSQASKWRIAPGMWNCPPVYHMWFDQTVTKSLMSFNCIRVVNCNARCLYWMWKYRGLGATMPFKWPAN